MIDESFTVGGVPTLEIANSAGTVTIDPSHDTDRVRVRVETSHPERWEVEQSSDTISVREVRRGWRSDRARIHVSAPAGTNLTLSSASANVTTNVALGRASISTASGDVRVEQAAALVAKSASGDVSVAAIGGDVTAKSASGDLQLDRVSGGLEASTASGDVRIGRIDGRVKVSTASGDVRIERFGGDSLHANTASGDVTVGIPTGTSVDLDVKTMTGRVDLPQRQRSRGSEPGRGRPIELRIKSVSGDFRLNRAD